jgi:chorismate mutase/prephenate dehydrogenase
VDDPGLDALRKEVAQLDASIRHLIARRLGLAQKIGLHKQARGLPLRDFTIERDVLRRYRDGLGRWVAPERAESLARWVVEESLRVQETVGEPADSRRTPSDVLVVGGFGQMGGWLREFFRANGHRVGIVDPRAEGRAPPGVPVHTDLGRAAQDADAVVVATPMRAAPAVYKELLATETEAVVFDVLSIKAPLVPWIRRLRAAGFHVTSVHPLFGPSARALSGRNLVVLDCGDPAANEKAVGLFRSSSLAVSIVPLDEHDALMAEALALPHAVNLLFGTVLADRAAGATLANVAPASFQRQSETAGVVTAENPQLAFDIQTLNPASEALFGRMATALETIRTAIRRQDSAMYEALLADAREAVAAAISGESAPPVRRRAGRVVPPAASSAAPSSAATAPAGVAAAGESPSETTSPREAGATVRPRTF